MINKHLSALCILALFLSSKLIIAQNLNIVYKAKSIASYDIVDTKVDIEYFTSLKINNGKSIYSRDSLILKSTYPKEATEIWPKKSVYKDFNNDLYIVESSEFKEDLLYETRISSIGTRKFDEWTYTNESELICDLICKKAISGFDTIWYTLDLPYSDGPQFGVFNLEGLVLKYKTLYGVWEAVSISYEPIEEIIIPKGKTTTSKNNIRITYGELLKLSSEEAITINDQLEINKFVTFKHK